MIQSPENLRFAPETRHTIGIGSESRRQEFDGNAASQLRVGGLINLTHPSRSQVAGDFVVCEFRSNHEKRIAMRGYQTHGKSLRRLKMGAAVRLRSPVSRVLREKVATQRSTLDLAN